MCDIIPNWSEASSPSRVKILSSSISKHGAFYGWPYGMSSGVEWYVVRCDGFHSLLFTVCIHFSPKSFACSCPFWNVVFPCSGGVLGICGAIAFPSLQLQPLRNDFPPRSLVHWNALYMRGTMCSLLHRRPRIGEDCDRPEAYWMGE